MAITAEQIKKLREQTGAGVLDAKRTLEEHNGDYEKALAVLKEKGQKAAAKKAERVAKQGVIDTYIHGGGMIGAMVEVNCETDFVARLDIFKELAHNLALQVAATNPRFVSPDDIPAAARSEQQTIFSDAARAEGKSDALVERIVTGKMESWYKDVCLLRQPFIRDDKTTIADLVQTVIVKTGENIVIRRFARFALGE